MGFPVIEYLSCLEINYLNSENNERGYVVAMIQFPKELKQGDATF
jgi:predicted metal-dependent hydrolase